MAIDCEQGYYKDLNKTEDGPRVEMMSDASVRYAVLPFQICESLGIEAGYERSFKIVSGNLLANRYLLGIPTSSLALDVAQQIAKKLGMPQDDDSFWSLYDQANLMLIGFEDSELGCVFKLYLEFWDNIRNDLVNTGSHAEHEPQLLHRGIKWNAEDPTQHVVSDYLVHPRLSTDQILDRINLLLSENSIVDPVLAILKIVFQRCDGQQMIYVEVDEDKGARRSFDLNVYQAGLLVDDVFPICRDVMKQLGVDPAAGIAMESNVKSLSLGHLAAGTNRTGKEFLTVYYEPKQE